MNEALAAMVRAMSDPSKAVDSSQIAGGRLGGRATGDPRMAVLLEVLRGTVSEPEPCSTPPAAEAIARAVLAERDELRRRVTLLAAALGACDQCWGEGAACPTCGGVGRPGSSAPHAELFSRFAEPAAARLLYLKRESPIDSQPEGD